MEKKKKKTVFKRDKKKRKKETELACLISSGCSVQSWGALTPEALSPLVFSLDLEITKSPVPEDLRLHSGHRYNQGTTSNVLIIITVQVTSVDNVKIIVM